jgi:ribosomal protein S18 acetylase RimI-like enzyme
MINIRRVEQRDFPRIVEMTCDLAAFVGAGLVPLISIAALEREGPFGKDRLRIVVAEQNAEIVGFCLYSFVFSGWRGSCGLFVEDLYIEPQARRLGLGKRLLSAAANYEKDNDIAYMKLEASLHNETAVQFYKKNGFHNFEGEVIMVLETPEFIKLSEQS